MSVSASTPKLPNHDAILAAIESCREIQLTWYSKDDGGAKQTRRCAPMDYAVSRKYKDGMIRYHFWDFESDTGINHTISLRADQILTVDILDSNFDPASFVAWDTSKSRWTVPRSSWGSHN